MINENRKGVLRGYKRIVKEYRKDVENNYGDVPHFCPPFLALGAKASSNVINASKLAKFQIRTRNADMDYTEEELSFDPNRYIVIKHLYQFPKNGWMCSTSFTTAIPSYIVWEWMNSE